MTLIKPSTGRAITAFCILFLTESCSPTLRWIPDPLPQPSCEPDRLLQWSDFVPRSGTDARAAETTIRIIMDQRSHTLRVVFDRIHSWVKPELANPNNSRQRRMSEQLLTHEQLHYIISCLVVRQANLSINEQDNPETLLESTRQEAQRLNYQYDLDTHHGTHFPKQELWRNDIMQKFAELGTQREE